MRSMLAFIRRPWTQPITVAALAVAFTLAAVLFGNAVLTPWRNVLQAKHAHRCFEAARNLFGDEEARTDGLGWFGLVGLYSPDRRCIAHTVLYDISYNSVESTGGPPFNHNEYYYHSLVDVYGRGTLGSYAVRQECLHDTPCKVTLSYAGEIDTHPPYGMDPESHSQPRRYLTFEQFLQLKQSVLLSQPALGQSASLFWHDESE